MQTMKLGEVTISRVIEIDRSSFPTASMLPDSSADVIARHHQWLKPHFFDERTGDLGQALDAYREAIAVGEDVRAAAQAIGLAVYECP